MQFKLIFKIKCFYVFLFMLAVKSLNMCKVGPKILGFFFPLGGL